MTVREETNALTCCAFRNGYLEQLHAGKHSELLEEPGLPRITDAEMKKVKIGAWACPSGLLAMKETEPERYWERLRKFHAGYCRAWEK